MQLPLTRPNRHRVQRQIVELAIGASAEAPAVQRELARPFWERAVPELERVFDGVAGPDEVLRVDRLEIDLGTVNGMDWTTEFRRRLIAQLGRGLADYGVVADVRETDSRTDSPTAGAWRQFVFFLIHGHLPWWGTKPSAGWTDMLTQRSDAGGWRMLREAALSYPEARVRLVHALSDDFLDTAIANWSGLRYAARALEQLTPKHLRRDAHRRWRSGFWNRLIGWVSAGGFGSPRGGPELVRDLLTLEQACASDSERRESFHPAPRDHWEHGDATRMAQGDDLPEPWHEWRLSQGDETQPSHDATQGPTDAGTMTGRGQGQSPSQERAPSDEVVRRTSEDEAIYVEGAGAVLLHPFFEPLFRERRLLTGPEFRDAEARDRAVQLLGLLTFGSIDVPEYDLVLAKAICGAAVEKTLEPVELEADDLVACDALLRAVLGHWTALGSSSPEWLRQQFFLREGKLELGECGYLLTIERRAQDVLLTRLPWSCGVLAPPWLAERIFVRWLE